MKEKRKPSESYQNKGKSLITTITFNKLKQSEDVCMTYRILQTKGRRKARYIMEAINHYNKYYLDDNNPYLLLDFVYPVKICRAIQTEYEITTIDSLERFLNDTDYEPIEKCLYKRGEAKQMLLGFSEADKDFFDYFNSLSMTERILLTTRSVKAYYLDGADRDSKAWRLVLDEELVRILKRYKASHDPAFVQNMWAMMECCTKVDGPWLADAFEALDFRDIKYSPKKTEEELKELLIDVEDIDSIL